MPGLAGVGRALTTEFLIVACVASSALSRPVSPELTTESSRSWTKPELASPVSTEATDAAVETPTNPPTPQVPSTVRRLSTQIVAPGVISKNFLFLRRMPRSS